MRRLRGTMLVALCCALAFGAAAASLPKSWKLNTEAEVPKGIVVGGDSCSKVTAYVHDLDQPYSDPVFRDKPMSGRERMSGGGQYGDPKELKNWVEFRLRQTCGNKKLYAQMWAKTQLSKTYSFAMARKCPGWTMKQNYLTPAASGSLAPATYLSLDVRNYPATPKSVQVRLWAANDYEGQAKGSATCPK